MQLMLTATGVYSKVELFRLQVDEHGTYTYESRAVARAKGQLSKGDATQLKSLYDKVEWNLEVLNAPLNADDTTLFTLEVVDGGERRVYQSSEQMTHRSWQFRDLIHFLRHNVATAGDPVGPPPDQYQEQPPATQ